MNGSEDINGKEIMKLSAKTRLGRQAKLNGTPSRYGDAVAPDLNLR